jgi:hypothetical protein
LSFIHPNVIFAVCDLGACIKSQQFSTEELYRKCATVDELTEFWNMPQEDFETCTPVQWWHQRRAQFPNLYRLARDIFSIPGIFSALIFVYTVYS